MNLFDLHADTPLIFEDKNKKSAVDMLNHPFEKYIQTFAVFIREDDKNGYLTFKNRLNDIEQFSAKNSIPIVTDKLHSGILLSVENAIFLADDINLIYNLYNASVKMISLCWNNDNPLASGANGSGGITPLGEKVIGLMNKLGIALDISHLSHKAAIQGIDLANKVLATHSNVFDLHPHPRNLKRDALLKLKQKGGIVGICFYPQFLGGGDVFCRIKAQLDYLVSLGMQNNISIGTDFDGADMAPTLCKTKQIYDLYIYLQNEGFEKPFLERIFYKNAIDFFS
ncbi:MAG: membrane dipeptidase [Clostridia bacterium]|nr:membrane dipeptidase [Clostridia bacterium]